jgi:hypothetical protein
MRATGADAPRGGGLHRRNASPIRAVFRLRERRPRRFVVRAHLAEELLT